VATTQMHGRCSKVESEADSNYGPAHLLWGFPYPSDRAPVA
jgi:hypothetical protein